MLRLHLFSKRRFAGKMLGVLTRRRYRDMPDQLAKERSGQTLQPRVLVHEAWMRLAGDEGVEV
jgi:hypothetical protein